MFGLEQFVEIPAVGALLIVGILPFFLATGNASLISEFLQHRLTKKYLSQIAAVGVVLLFIVGLVGNQLIDAVVEDELVPGQSRYETLYKKWRRS